jgi:hypothetical protein
MVFDATTTVRCALLDRPQVTLGAGSNRGKCGDNELAKESIASVEMSKVRAAGLVDADAETSSITFIAQCREAGVVLNSKLTVSPKSLSGRSKSAIGQWFMSTADEEGEEEPSLNGPPGTRLKLPWLSASEASCVDVGEKRTGVRAFALNNAEMLSAMGGEETSLTDISVSTGHDILLHVLSMSGRLTVCGVSCAY